MVYTKRYLDDLRAVSATVPEGLAGQKVLVTGAGGLICSALVDLLMELGATVYAAGRSPERLRARFSHWEGNGQLHFLPYDAMEPFVCPVGFDYLIHGASNANPSAYSQQPVQTMLGNFIGMQQILEHARKSGGKRVLYVSSSEVYGKKEGSEPYHEAEYGFVDILNPRACYPSSKRAAETLCAAYFAQYGVDTVIVRPGHVYGPTATAGDTRVSSQFPRDVLAGKDIVMKSAGSQLRSYCYVLDCVSAMVMVLLKGQSGKAYNISNRDSLVTIRQMAEGFATAAGRKILFENPSDLEAKNFNLMDNSALDASSLEALGWRGMFDLQTGVEATLDAMT